MLSVLCCYQGGMLERLLNLFFFCCYHTCRFIFIQQQPQRATKMCLHVNFSFSFDFSPLNLVYQMFQKLSVTFLPTSEGEKNQFICAEQKFILFTSWPSAKNLILSLWQIIFASSENDFYSSVRMSNFYQLNMLFCVSIEQHFSCIQIERNIKNPFG